MMRLSLFCTGEKYLFIVTSLTMCIRWQSSLFKLKVEKIETANVLVNASAVWLVQGFLARIGKWAFKTFVGANCVNENLNIFDTKTLNLADV